MIKKIDISELTTGSLIILNKGDRCIVQKNVFFASDLNTKVRDIESQEKIIFKANDYVFFAGGNIMPIYLFENMYYKEIKRILVPKNVHSIFSLKEEEYELIYENRKICEHFVTVKFNSDKLYLFSVPDEQVENLLNKLENNDDATKVVVETKKGLQIATVDAYGMATEELMMDEVVRKYHATLPLKKVVGVLK